MTNNNHKLLNNYHKAKNIYKKFKNKEANNQKCLILMKIENSYLKYLKI